MKRLVALLCALVALWFAGIVASWSRGSRLLARCEKRSARLRKATRDRGAARAAAAAKVPAWGPPPGDPRYRNYSRWWPLLWPAGERRHRAACAPCGYDEAAFLVPSFPTSGSAYVKTFFSEVTGLGHGEVYGPQEGFGFLRLYGEPGDEFASFYYDERFPAPVGTATLLKTHYPAIVDDEQADADVFPARRLDAYFHGVVLLARNPIDAVVGQKVRWACHAQVHQASAWMADRALTPNETAYWEGAYRRQYEACRDAAVSGLCESPEAFDDEVRTWNAFHEYWLDAAAAATGPFLLLRYEDMLAAPAATFLRLARFANASFDDRRLRAAVAAQLRRHPAAAAHGTRLRDVCATAETQDVLLEATRGVADRLGYAHDGARAVVAATGAATPPRLESDLRRLDARVRAARAIRDAADAVKAADARRDADERRAKKRDKRRRHHSFFHQIGF